MKFTDIFIKRPVLAISISLLIVILGLQAISKLAVREYPKMTTTVLTVQTNYPGADASLVQALITSKLEEAIAQADNIDYLSSQSAQSSSTITVKMKLNTDPSAALADVLGKINSVRSELPTDIEDPTLTSSTGGTALMYLSFSSERLDASQVTDYLQRIVKPQLFTVQGIAKLEIYGAGEYAMRIWLDPEKMAAQKLSAGQVANALANNNIQTAAGSSKGYFNIYKNKVETTTTTVEELSNLIVSSDGDNLVRLRDIATVELNSEADDSRTSANGKDAVVLAVETTSDANPLDVANAIYPVYDQIKAEIPDSIQTNILYDTTTAINSSIHDVIHTIVEAMVIVLVVILLFLGSFRAIIIPIITIPISIIGVLFILQGLGYSINLMTLLAMILAIGLVVDDAIVVLENVDRHIKEGETPFRAAIIGTREIATPVISMTIALVAVYSPMALMDGITGSLFKEFALTLAGSVFISGIVALTLSPMMSGALLRHSHSKFEERVNNTLNKVTESYGRWLNVIMASRRSVLLFAIIIFATIPVLLNSLSSELTPAEDKGGFLGVASAPSHVNLDYMQGAVAEYDAILQALPESKFSLIISGVPTTNQAIIISTLKDWKERSRKQPAIMNELNQKAAAIPEISISNFAFPEINTGEQGASVGFVLMSPADNKQLAEEAERFLAKIRASGKFVYADTDLKYETAQATFAVDKEKAGTYGITMADISATLGYYLAEATITRVDIEGRGYKMISQVKRDNRLSPESMDKYYVSASNGESVPLSSLVTMTLEPQPMSLNHFSQLNAATFQLVPSPTSTTGDAVAWLKEAAKDLPAGYRYDFKSEARQLEQEGNSLVITFALAVAIIFLVLAIQFESWRDPTVILVSVPLALSGALLTLNVLSLFGVEGVTLNIYSEVGLITLVGLITKHGILMCEVAMEEQLHRGASRIDAIKLAARQRLRPILMTTAAMIAGLVPLLYASGAGAVMRFSMGVVIVAGLAIGTLFTLFVLPVIYSYLASEHKPLPEFDENAPRVSGASHH
ncbi:efflux RND transporter permease subunit [Lonepinella koalarum]|uniref:efflux RND transporter permease subunit n=1 Tax=Lonepinella koalarum TaxID=53417 RepID=UPI003F6E0D82